MLSRHVWQILSFILFATASLATCTPNQSWHDGIHHERVPLRNLSTDEHDLVVFANTGYEELTSLGFNPHFNLLSATIQIKLSTGYGGDLCSSGSIEYVRFWVNYGDRWSDIGLASLNVHNLLDSVDCEGKPTKPLSYTLSIKFEPKHEACGQPILPMIRATLSWGVVPPADDPLWDPVFGNSLEGHIESLATDFKLRPAVMPLNTNSTSRTDRCADRRYLEAIIADQDQQVLGASDAHEHNARLNIRQNVDFEEIVFVGIDWEFNSLIAHVRIKQPNGYTALPCDTTSFEFVSFWADLGDSCTWTLLGTAKFNVHDFGTAFPPTGLVYTVIMPLGISKLAVPCDQTKIIRVQAALAFNEPPPPPPAVAARGNFIETHVHIKPQTAVPLPTDPHIRTIGNVAVQQIDTSVTGKTLGQAVVIGYGFADPSPSHDRSCPFGGVILVKGEPIEGYLYRLLARGYSSSEDVPPGSPVTKPFVVFDPIDDSIPPNLFKRVDPIDDGYFEYLPVLNNFEMLLGAWDPGPGDWQIRLEVYTADTARTLVGKSSWYRIFVNDQQPTAHLALTVAGGNPRCGELSVGQRVEGTFDANAAYFGFYSFDVAPHFTPGLQVVPAGSTEPAPPGTWSIDTQGATPCGYAVGLVACDRTVVNSGTGRFCVSRDLGFCLLRPVP